MKLNRGRASRSRRAVGGRNENLQPKLFDLKPAPADSQSSSPALHPTRPEEARPVDFKGATEYGLLAQLPLFEAAEPVPERGSNVAGKEGGSTEFTKETTQPLADTVSTGARNGAEESTESPEAFLKLIARIALRVGQNAATENQEEDGNEGGSVPEGEQ